MLSTPRSLWLAISFILCQRFLMEALVAVGLAGNVVQFVTCAGSLIAQVNYIRMHESPKSLPELVKLSKTLTGDAATLKTRLKASTATLKEEDQNLLDLATECEESGIRFLDYLKKWDKKSSGILHNAKTALKFQWKLHQIEEFAGKIEKLRGSLTLATVLAFRTSVESNHEDILEHLKQLQINAPPKTTVNDTHQLQYLIDVLSDVIEHHTVDRLNAIHKQISASLNSILAIRTQQITDEKKHGHEQDILSWLDFRQIHWRYDAVDDAYQDTYNWIFESANGTQEWDDLGSHLRQDVKDPYFIDGKAGSGKSTLMKYIVDNRKTREALKEWAGQDPLLILPFFFWNIGTTLQKSHIGLLRALLYTVLSKHPELVPAVFPKLFHNWKGSDAEIAPDYTELKRAFELMIQKSTYLKLAIMIDGIDEFEGDHRDMSLFLRSLGSPRVKLIISSRPLNSCLEALEGCPTLRLQDLTRRDMAAFVQGELATHHLMIRLLRQFPDRAPLLAVEVVEKAAGVFLWVRLVVRLLIEGLEDGDDLDELEARLSSLPPDLRELYRRMLEKMSTKNQRQASEVFQIVQTWNKKVNDQQIPGLVLSYALKAPKECFDVPIAPMDCEAFDSEMYVLSKRIRSRCCGLLEVHHVKMRRLRREAKLTEDQSIDDPVTLDEANKTVVTYMHRTVAELLDTKTTWEDICAFTRDRNYDPSVRLTSGCLSTIKMATHLRDVSLRWLLQLTTMFCGSATKLPIHVYARYLVEIDNKMCELQQDLQGPDGDTDYNPKDKRNGGHSNYNPKDTAHWSVSWIGPELARLKYKYVSLETFAAARGLYFFSIPSNKPKTDYSWFVNIWYAISSWRRTEFSEDYLPDRSQRKRTLEYLAKHMRKFEDTSLIHRLWHQVLETSTCLQEERKYLDAAELLYTFLKAHGSPRRLWELSREAYELGDAEYDPQRICRGMFHACRKAGWEDDQNQDDAMRVLKELHLLVSRNPVPGKRILDDDDGGEFLSDTDASNFERASASSSSPQPYLALQPPLESSMRRTKHQMLPDSENLESSERTKRRRVNPAVEWHVPAHWNTSIDSNQCPLEEWEIQEADHALDMEE
ncbi:small s protein [Paraphaeosphaeria sporulosa]